MEHKSTRWAFFKWHTIRATDGSPYLVRLRILQTPLFAFYLHWILRSDDRERGLHDHPWDFVSVILRGGYVEHTSTGRKWYGPGSVLYRRAEAFHAIGVERPAMSLVFCMRRRRPWGFQPPAIWKASRNQSGFRLIDPRGGLVGHVYTPRSGQPGWSARNWSTGKWSDHPTRDDALRAIEPTGVPINREVFDGR